MSKGGRATGLEIIISGVLRKRTDLQHKTAEALRGRFLITQLSAVSPSSSSWPLAPDRVSSKSAHSNYSNSRRATEQHTGHRALNFVFCAQREA